ncbi:MAG: hypothetical protein ACI4KF_02750 [Huintestinicola sp.]
MIMILKPEYNFGGLTKIEMTWATRHSKQSDLMAVCDNNKRIYGVDSNNRVKYYIDADDLGYDGKAEFRDIVLDTDGKLYACLVVFNKDAYMTDMNLILSFDENGKFIREICRYDYRYDKTKPPRTSLIKALNVTENKIRYIYVNDSSLSLVSANKNNSASEEEAKLELEEYNALNDASPAPDGSYGMILVNGDIIRAYHDGTFSTILEGNFSLNDPENGFYPRDILAFNDHMLVTEGLSMGNLYTINDGEAPQLIYTSDDDPDDFYWSFDSVEHIGDRSGTILGGHFYEFTEGGYVRVDEDYPLSAKLAFLSCLDTFLPIIATVCIICGLISVTGCLMHWRMNLLSKQLFISLPLILLMGISITFAMFVNMLEEYINQRTLQMQTVLDMSGKFIDGDLVERITDLGAVDDGSLYQLHQSLKEMLNFNASDWSSRCTCNIFTDPDSVIHYLIATSDLYDIPYNMYTKDLYEINPDQSRPSVYYQSFIDELYMCAETPVYDSEKTGSLYAADDRCQ